MSLRAWIPLLCLPFVQLSSLTIPTPAYPTLLWPYHGTSNVKLQLFSFSPPRTLRIQQPLDSNRPTV
ncbi:hypothetical protein M408DRAFT_146162 [Serendipita vermifera MAFF 305830]|uniref:Secreted protein n=1 Tax=Serendipita vermifera MAFF 305830 TaxID=933852 RepID=A0A0C3ALQ5_SERVB|nr:hypothetical protein M408DRAFT_146162 [Serendipita vermifera MAFF 305830]